MIDKDTVWAELVELCEKDRELAYNIYAEILGIKGGNAYEIAEIIAETYGIEVPWEMVFLIRCEAEEKPAAPIKPHTEEVRELVKQLGLTRLTTKGGTSPHEDWSALDKWDGLHGSNRPDLDEDVLDEGVYS